MSVPQPSVVDPRLIQDAPGVRGAWQGFRRRVSQGELGSLPVIVGLSLIWLIFYVANERFLSAVNLTNLMLQIAAMGTISAGIVLVLLDEPTAALGVAQTRQVLDLIRRLREQGLGVVVISHNLMDVFSVADRIIVLRRGKRVATFDAKAAKEVEVVSAITGAKKQEVIETLKPEVV